MMSPKKCVGFIRGCRNAFMREKKKTLGMDGNPPMRGPIEIGGDTFPFPPANGQERDGEVDVKKAI